MSPAIVCHADILDAVPQSCVGKTSVKQCQVEHYFCAKNNGAALRKAPRVGCGRTLAPSRCSLGRLASLHPYVQSCHHQKLMLFTQKFFFCFPVKLPFLCPRWHLHIGDQIARGRPIEVLPVPAGKGQLFGAHT